MTFDPAWFLLLVPFTLIVGGGWYFYRYATPRPMIYVVRESRWSIYIFVSVCGIAIGNWLGSFLHVPAWLLLAWFAFALHAYTFLGWSRLNILTRQRTDTSIVVRPLAAALLVIVCVLQLIPFLLAPADTPVFLPPMALTDPRLANIWFWLRSLALYGYVTGCLLLFVAEALYGLWRGEARDGEGLAYATFWYCLIAGVELVSFAPDCVAQIVYRLSGWSGLWDIGQTIQGWGIVVLAVGGCLFAVSNKRFGRWYITQWWPMKAHRRLDQLEPLVHRCLEFLPAVYQLNPYDYSSQSLEWKLEQTRAVKSRGYKSILVSRRLSSPVSRVRLSAKHFASSARAVSPLVYIYSRCCGRCQRSRKSRVCCTRYSS